jgi:hypothetical protein
LTCFDMGVARQASSLRPASDILHHKAHEFDQYA